MAAYNYVCTDCERKSKLTPDYNTPVSVVDHKYPIGTAPPTLRAHCNECGETTLYRKLVSSSGNFVLRGTGWGAE